MEFHKTIIVPFNLIELGRFNFGISYMIQRSPYFDKHYGAT